MKWLIDLTKKLKPYQNQRFLLAISGGMDSMALFHIFLHFKKHFGFDFEVAHFHHGLSQDDQCLRFRENALQFVKNQCQQHGVKCYVKRHQGLSAGDTLSSEADMRQARYVFLENILAEQGLHYLVLAHHQEDLLETRLIRLIRGTGPEGLQAMGFVGGNRMRPLLKISRQTLNEYLVSQNRQWLEDPSNQDTKYFRNWMREVWLKQLEEKSPGALSSLNRSLDLLVKESGGPVLLDSILDGKGIILSELLTFDLAEKRQLLAAYMKSQGLRNYGLSHVNEVLKRLDRVEKAHTFRLLGKRWKVDAGRMSVEEPS